MTSCNVNGAKKRKNRQLLLLPRQSESLILFVKDAGIQSFDIFSKTSVNFNTSGKKLSSYFLHDDSALKIQASAPKDLPSMSSSGVNILNLNQVS